MNLTVTTAWVIVEFHNHHALLSEIIYPSEKEATHQMELMSVPNLLAVVSVDQHIQAVYELGRDGPGFM